MWHSAACLAKGLKDGLALQKSASVSVCLERESIAAGGLSSKKEEWRRGAGGDYCTRMAKGR